MQVLVGHVSDLAILQLHAAVAEFLALQHDALAGAQAQIGPAGLLGPETEKLREVGHDHRIIDKIRRWSGRLHGFTTGRSEADESTGQQATRLEDGVRHRRDL